MHLPYAPGVGEVSEHRPTQRQNMTADNALAGASGSTVETYFDRLSRDVAVEFMRQMSSRPRSSKWKAFLKPEVALVFLQLGGLLSDAARSVFTGFVLNPGNDFLSSDDLCDLHLRISSDSPNTFHALSQELDISLARLELNLHAYGYLDPWVSGLRYSNLRALVLKRSTLLV